MLPVSPLASCSTRFIKRNDLLRTSTDGHQRQRVYQKSRSGLVHDMRHAAPEIRADAMPRRILLTAKAPIIGSHRAERPAGDPAGDIRVSALMKAALADHEPARVALMGGLQCDRSTQLGDYK
jgi:hypothetical protein